MKKVLVVGDTILDIYSYGMVNRISPEAPVPVFDYKTEEHVLGGACNTAANIRSLSKDPNLVIDYFGFFSGEIRLYLSEYKVGCVGIPIDSERILTKNRFICNKMQLLRVDNNQKYVGDDILSIKELQFKNFNFSDYDIIIVSDYDKQTIGKYEFDILSQQNVCKIIDLKRVRPDMNWKKNDKCILKCNLKEFEENPHIVHLGPPVIVTTGDQGYWLPQLNQRFPKAKNDEVVDVVGCGDVFLAGMAVNYLETGNFDLYEMAAFGNLCASEKVKHFGTVAVKRSLI